MEAEFFLILLFVILPLSLRRHNPDQVLRVVALATFSCLATSQLPNEAPLGPFI